MLNAINKFKDFFIDERNVSSPLIPMISYKVRNIDGTSMGATTLFTTQSANFRMTDVVIDLTAVSDLIVAPTISIGTNATNYDNVMAPLQTTTLTSASNHLLIRLSGIFPDIASSTIVKINVSIGAASATYTFDATIVGFYDT